MMQLVVKREWLAKRLYRSTLCDRFIRYDLRCAADFTDEDLIAYIYRRVGIHGGITKQTAQNRFSTLDTRSAELIAAQDLPRVHDIGVSSGITSVELFERLQAVGANAAKVTVSDRYARFYAQENGLQTDLFDADQRLQCSYLGPLYGDRHTSSKYPLSQWLYRRAAAFDGDQAKPFYLFHPKLLRLIDTGAISVLEYDVLNTKITEPFTYVRCMNLLNLSYFEESALLQGIGNVKSSIADGGVLQIGRTEQSGENHVGFYHKTRAGLERFEQIGDGSEVHDLIIASNAQTQSLAS